jgi:hypothetical protein
LDGFAASLFFIPQSEKGDKEMMRHPVLIVCILILIIGACTPATTPIPVPTATAGPTLTALPTRTSNSTALPTGTPTLTATATVRPSETQTSVLIPAFSAPTATVRPTRTRSALPTSTQTPTLLPTGTPTATTELQATGTAPPTTPSCPIPTAELFWVDPVTSPTDQLSQVIIVYIGNGEEVTVVTESGTFNVTGIFGPYGNPALVEVSLLPNTEHHLEVFAKVREVPSWNGCIYGHCSTPTDVAVPKGRFLK